MPPHRQQHKIKLVANNFPPPFRKPRIHQNNKPQQHLRHKKSRAVHRQNHRPYNGRFLYRQIQHRLCTIVCITVRVNDCRERDRYLQGRRRKRRRLKILSKKRRPLFSVSMKKPNWINNNDGWTGGRDLLLGNHVG